MDITIFNTIEGGTDSKRSKITGIYMHYYDASVRGKMGFWLRWYFINNVQGYIIFRLSSEIPLPPNTIILIGIEWHVYSFCTTGIIYIWHPFRFFFLTISFRIKTKSISLLLHSKIELKFIKKKKKPYQ